MTVKNNIKELQSDFQAEVDLESFGSLYEARIHHPEIKTPIGLDRHFLLSGDPKVSRIASLVRLAHENERRLLRIALSQCETELSALSQTKRTAALEKKLSAGERKRQKLLSKLDLSLERITPLDDRVFPATFAPTILARGPQRWIVPMRFRLRQPDGTEIPSKYNVFNARRDSLVRAPTWRPLFGRSHAIFPFQKFFEWVDREGKKREIAFTPENRGQMWAASLYSRPNPSVIPSFLSFAMITDEPPPEVAAAGHDRCPIFLKEDQMDAWLRPEKKSQESLLALLELKEKAFYINNLVA